MAADILSIERQYMIPEKKDKHNPKATPTTTDPIEKESAIPSTTPSTIKNLNIEGDLG